MPLYEFKCCNCGRTEAKILKRVIISGVDKVFYELYCPECSSPMDQILSVPSPLQWGPGVRNF